MLEPNDPIWKTDRVYFAKGSAQFSIWDGHLTSPNPANHPNASAVLACLRQPNLAGDPFSSIGLGAFASQPLRLPLVI